MPALRAFIRDHRRLAVWLVVLALCMKVLVPQGFMIGAGRSLSITICDGQGAASFRQISLPQTGKVQDHAPHEGKAQDACPYAALGMAGLAGAPPVLLAAAIAFILARRLVLAPFALAAAPAFLRPPLRAPPLRGSARR